MNETLESILKSLENGVSIAIQKYESEKDTEYLNVAIEQLILVIELMKGYNGESETDFKNSVSGMLAALQDMKNGNRKQLISALDVFM